MDWILLSKYKQNIAKQFEFDFLPSCQGSLTTWHLKILRRQFHRHDIAVEDIVILRLHKPNCKKKQTTWNCNFWQKEQNKTKGKIQDLTLLRLCNNCQQGCEQQKLPHFLGRCHRDHLDAALPSFVRPPLVTPSEDRLVIILFVRPAEAREMHVLSWNILAPSLFLTYWREYYAGDETESEAGADVDAYFATVVEAKAIGVACAIEDMIGQFNPDVICLQETTVLGAANLTFGSPRLHAAIMEHDVRWKQLLAAKGYTLVSHTRKPHLQAFKIPVRNEEMQDRGRIGTTGVMIFARIDSRDGYCAVQGGGSADCIVPASIIVQSTEVASSRGVQTTPVVAVEFQVKNAISGKQASDRNIFHSPSFCYAYLTFFVSQTPAAAPSCLLLHMW